MPPPHPNLFRKHIPQHTQKPLPQSPHSLHPGLHRLPRRPPQAVRSFNPPFPLPPDRIPLLVLLGLFLLILAIAPRVQLSEVGLVEAEVTGLEGRHAGRRRGRAVGVQGGGGIVPGFGGGVGGHFLAGLVLVPLLALLLPLDQRVDLGDGGGLVDLLHVHRALEEGVHVQLAAFGSVAQELEDPFQPAHERGEEAVVVDVDFVDEFVEVFLVAGAEVDEGLDGLVGVRRDVLALRRGQDAEHVVGEGREVCDGVVDVGRFVDADEGLVEDSEEVAEEVQGYRFFDYGEHLGFVPLAGVHFEERFEVREELGAELHFIVDVVYGVVPGHEGVEHFAYLFGFEFGGDFVGSEDCNYEVDLFGDGFAADLVL